MRWGSFLLAVLVLTPAVPLTPGASGQVNKPLSENAQMEAVAVARTQDGGTIGTTATISVTVSANGTGGVFLDTRPLTGTDMQGSARIAARVASALTGYELAQHDFYFVVRSESPVISGPSAGSVMGLAATVALENLHRAPDEPAWNISDRVMVTGTISPDGSIGPVGGILEKARAAAKAGAGLFLVPEGQGTLTAQGEAGQPAPTVNVSEHCTQEIGIHCREVGQLEDLVRLATGHRFVQPDIGEPPSTESYESTLRPLADQLVDRAQRFQQVWTELNRTDLGPAAQQQITSVLEGALADVKLAEGNVEEGRFYSAASRAFTAAIQARHADLLLEFHRSERDADVVEDALANATRAVQQARQAARGANVSGMQDLYTVGAAQKRVSEAEQRLEIARQAWNGTRGPDAGRALQEAARSIERSATVHWWLRLSEAFGPGPALPTSVDPLSDEMLDLADEMLAYTRQVLGGQQPSEAARLMGQARNDQERGFHAGAAIEAAEVQVVSALILELQLGRISEDRVNDSRSQAARAIQQARQLGVEPVLPVALFEFGGVQESPGASLRFYRTARVLAGMSQTLDVASDPTPTEFVGAWSGETPPTPVGHSYRSVALGWFTIGLFGTGVLALGVLALIGPRQRYGS